MEERNWTYRNGVANSSREYLACVEIVERMIRTLTIGSDPYFAARSIVSHLANDAELAPMKKSRKR